MQKKVVIAIALIGTIILGGGLWWFGRSSGKTNLISPGVPTTSNEPTKAPSLKILKWEDPAGFIFEYPEGIKINNHPEGKVDYANLELTASNVEGKITVFASDSKYKTVEEWATKDKVSQLTGGGTEISLGGKKARKVVFSDTQRTMVGAIDDEILFTIDFTPESTGYWQKAFDQIVSSFKFWQPTPAESSAPASGGGGEIIEEEEIIE